MSRRWARVASTPRSDIARGVPARDGGTAETQREEKPLVVKWRRVAAGTVAAALVAAAVIWIIARAAGLSDLERTFSAGNPVWFVACVIGQLVVFSGYAVVYREAVRFEGGPSIGRGLALRVVVTGFGFAQLIAAAGAASLAVNYWALRRLGFGRRDSLVRMIGYQTLVYLVFGVIGWTAALIALLMGVAPLAMTLPWLAAIPPLVVAARWFTAERRVRPWVANTTGLIRRGLSIGVGAAWWVRRALPSRAGRPLLAGAAGYWVGDMLSLWAGLRAFDASPALAALVLAYATGYVASALPLPFIATGGIDAAMTFALNAVGVPLEQALLGVVAHRVFAFWLPLVPALVLASGLRRTGRELERAAASAP